MGLKKGQRRLHYRRITPEKRRQVLRLAAQGATYQQIAETVDLSRGSVGIVVMPLGGVIRKEMWEPSESRLSLEERVEIRLGLEADLSVRAIARRIGRHPFDGVPGAQSQWRTP